MNKTKGLVFEKTSKDDVNKIINEFANVNKNYKILVIADKYNYENTIKRLNENCNVVLCDGAQKKQEEKIIKENTYDKVIAVGGCSALDVGRACALKAKKDKSIISIPTILSTSCISVDKAILYDEERNKIVMKTEPPEYTIIPFNTIKNTNEEDLIKWNSSGIGDMLADISAIIEYLFLNDKLSKNVNIYDLVKDTFEKMGIINILKIAEILFDNTKNENLKDIHSNEAFLEKLSKWLHLSSLLANFYKEVAGGSEHEFYYSMFKTKKYPTELPTHGQLVSIGTLIVAKIISEVYKRDEIYNLLKGLYKSVGLPTTFSELEKINVRKEDIIKGIENMQNTFFLTRYFDEKILNKTFDNYA